MVTKKAPKKSQPVKAPAKSKPKASSGLKIAQAKQETREALFVVEYVRLKNGTKAAIASGFPEKSAHVAASRLLKKANVLEAILKATDEMVAAIKEKTKIDAEWVLERSVEFHNRCMQSEPVRDREGNATGEYKFEHTGVGKSLELIGKNVLVQAFRDQVGIGNPDGTDLTWVREVIPGKRKPVDP